MADIKTQVSNSQSKLTADIKDRTSMVYVALEVFADGDPDDRYWHLFPVTPESMTVAHRYLQTITPTLSGVFVDEFGRAPSPVTLQGTFGLWVNKFVPSAMAKHFGEAKKSRWRQTLEEITGAGAATANPSGRQFSGYQMAKWLQFLVEHSHEKSEKTGKPRRVKFHNFALDETYEVALNELNLTMSVQANNLWFYTLAMTVLRKEGPAPIKDNATPINGSESVFKAREIFNKLQKGLERYKKIEATVNRANRVLSRLSPGDLIEFGAEFLDSRLRAEPGTFLNLITTVSRLPATVEAVANIASQITSRLPNDVIRDFVQAKNAVQRAVEAVNAVSTQWPATQGTRTQTVSASIPAMVGAGPRSMGPSSRLNEIPEQDAAVLRFLDLTTRSEVLINSLNQSAEIAGTPLGGAVASNVASSSSVAEGTGSGSGGNAGVSRDVTPGPLSVGGVTQSYSVSQGDSLTALAERFLGSPERWTQIAAANADTLATSGTGLEFGPDDDLSLLVGAPIKIPASLTQNNIRASRDPFVYDTPIGLRSLGRDLPQRLETRLRADGTKDLFVLSPAETLAQGVSARLQTPLGAISDVTSFGSTIPLLVGENFGVFTEDLTASAIREALYKDGRIAGVSAVDVEVTLTGVVANFDAQLVDGTTLGVTDVSVTYDME